MTTYLSHFLRPLAARPLIRDWWWISHSVTEGDESPKCCCMLINFNNHAGLALFHKCFSIKLQRGHVQENCPFWFHSDHNLDITTWSMFFKVLYFGDNTIHFFGITVHSLSHSILRREIHNFNCNFIRWTCAQELLSVAALTIYCNFIFLLLLCYWLNLTVRG